MSKFTHSGIIVVEGETDRAFLSAFIDGEIIITNGSSVPCETLEYLKTASKDRDIIVLTDPDFPGAQIRNKIQEAISSSKHAFMKKEDCIARGKVGVAESDQEAVIEALKHLLDNSKAKESSLTYYDLVELGLAGSNGSSIKRQALMEKLHLGYGSGKVLLDRARKAGLSKKDLAKEIA